MTDFIVIIPARYASERLPGKPLRLLCGRPMIAHVHDRAVESGAHRVIVATDDPRIAAACGGEAVLTGADHATGTDRLAEVVTVLELPDETIVVNLQGDEPLMPPHLVHAVAAGLESHSDADIATLCAPLSAARAGSPHVVKVVQDRFGYALYFSRAAIPWPRRGFDGTEPGDAWHRHIGIYAYRAGFLRRFPELDAPPMETLERLEQLRALWHGFRIHVTAVREVPEHGVDTAEDLERVEERIKRG